MKLQHLICYYLKIEQRKRFYMHLQFAFLLQAGAVFWCFLLTVLRKKKIFVLFFLFCFFCCKCFFSFFLLKILRTKKIFVLVFLFNCMIKIKSWKVRDGMEKDGNFPVKFSTGLRELFAICQCVDRFVYV